MTSGSNKVKSLFELKKWLSVNDATKRLSSTMGEQVEMGDLFQLVLDGHLRLSWHTRRVYARSVVQFSYIWGRGFPPTSELKGLSQIGKILYCSKPFEERWRPWKDVSLEECDEVTMETWISSEGLDNTGTIVRLNGPYHLELHLCTELKEWLHSKITQTAVEQSLSDGFFVSDSDGNTWQIMKHKTETPEYINEAGETILPKPIYGPTGTFPPEEELIFLREEVESFERSLIAEDEPSKHQHETEVEFILNRFLDATNGTGGKPQLLRYMRDKLGAELLHGDKWKWSDPTGASHTKAQKTLENHLSMMRKKRN